jgi:hypothetical protein
MPLRKLSVTDTRKPIKPSGVIGSSARSWTPKLSGRCVGIGSSVHVVGDDKESSSAATAFGTRDIRMMNTTNDVKEFPNENLAVFPPALFSREAEAVGSVLLVVFVVVTLDLPSVCAIQDSFADL